MQWCPSVQTTIGIDAGQTAVYSGWAVSDSPNIQVGPGAKGRQRGFSVELVGSTMAFPGWLFEAEGFHGHDGSAQEPPCKDQELGREVC